MIVAKPPRSPKKAADKSALAKALGVSVRSVNTYISAGMASGNGPFDVAACRAWVANSIRPRAGTANGAGDIAACNLLEHKRRLECDLLAEKLAAVKLANDERSGELVDRRDVRQAWGMAMSRLKERILFIPEQCEMMLPVEVRPLVKLDLESYVRGLLTEISQWTHEEKGGADAQAS